MYHALGDQDQAHPTGAQPNQAPLQPPDPHSGPQYQHGGVHPDRGLTSHGTPSQEGTPQSYTPNQGSYVQGGYFPSQQNMAHDAISASGNVDSLASQMGGVYLGDGIGNAGVGRGQKKKKDRHAHHVLDSSRGPTPAFDGMPPSSPLPPGSQYLSNDPSHQLAPGGQYINPQASTPTSEYAGSGIDSFNRTGRGSRTDPVHGGSFSHPITSGAPGMSQQGRVDPEQIPSIPSSRDAPAQYYLEHTYATLEKHLPPPGAVPFIAYDQGNSSPKFARLTLNNIPSSAESLASTGLPLGLLLQPLAALQEGEQPIPVLDFGEPGPPRCRRCRAYINPFMMFRSGGNRFVCNMCTFPNEVPPEYFSPTDPNGVRVDREQRLELTRGTVEFMVPKEYWAKDPVGLRWLFLIDVGQEAINRGFLEGVCKGILHSLYGDDDTDVTGDASNGDEAGVRRSLPGTAKVASSRLTKTYIFTISVYVGQGNPCSTDQMLTSISSLVLKRPK